MSQLKREWEGTCRGCGVRRCAAEGLEKNVLLPYIGAIEGVQKSMGVLSWRENLNHPLHLDGPSGGLRRIKAGGTSRRTLKNPSTTVGGIVIISEFGTYCTLSRMHRPPGRTRCVRHPHPAIVELHQAQASQGARCVRHPDIDSVRGAPGLSSALFTRKGGRQPVADKVPDFSAFITTADGIHDGQIEAVLRTRKSHPIGYVKIRRY
jgi:hypothetical protein